MVVIFALPQVFVAFMGAFFVQLAEIGSGVAFIRATRSWPEEIALKANMLNVIWLYARVVRKGCEPGAATQP